VGKKVVEVVILQILVYCFRRQIDSHAFQQADAECPHNVITAVVHFPVCSYVKRAAGTR
jgi:hypothetical protein